MSKIFSTFAANLIASKSMRLIMANSTYLEILQDDKAKGNNS